MKFNHAVGQSSRPVRWFSSLFVLLPLACGGTIEGPNGDGDSGPDDYGDGEGGDGNGGNLPAGGGVSIGGNFPAGGGVSIGGNFPAGGGISVGGFPGAGGGFGGNPIIPVSPAGPLVGCETIDRYGDNSYCQLERECENGWSSTSCNTLDNHSNCVCSNLGNAQLNIAGLSASESCDRASTICENFTGPPLGTPIVCTPVATESAANSCLHHEECSQTAELDGAIISAITWNQVWCDDRTCECRVNNSLTRVELPSGTSTDSACTPVLELCNSVAVLPTGMGNCQPRHQSAYEDSCEVELECSRTVSFNGQPVTVYKPGYATCQRSGESTFECLCPGQQETITVPSSSGWDACSSVPKYCAL